MPYKDRERQNSYQKLLMRQRRLDPVIYQHELEYARARSKQGIYRRTGICEACGYSDTVDLHHDGIYKERHILCPNCHALITRGIKTLRELKVLQTSAVRPSLDADGHIIPDYQ